MSGLPVVRAAGTVLWRPGPDGSPLIGLVHRARYADWTHPKGKAEVGEHPVTTAARETTEETAHRVRLGPPLLTTRYEVDGRQKKVRYWSGRASDNGSFAPTEEIDDLVWLPVVEARERLTYPRDAEVLDVFLGREVETVPLVVLRHAKAVRRGDWAKLRDAGPDVERPLRTEGRRQAAALVPLLSAYGIESLVSSSARRCLETVDPYAEVLGRRPHSDDRLTEEAWTADPRAALDAVDEVSHDPAPALLCTHRPVLPTVLARVLGGSTAGRDATGRDAATVPGGPLSPGEFAVVHRGAEGIVAVERHTP